jgi:hypothetical protein
MISAKLYKAGQALGVYFLAIDGNSEVKSFLEERSRNPETLAIAGGFVHMIGHLADKGLHALPSPVFRCWRLAGEMFCELRKGSHRVSCFVYPDRVLLLATAFRKTRRKEDSEYARALRLKRVFDREGIWED